MKNQTNSSVVGVFNDHARAQQAVNALKRAGFTDDQIGVIGRDSRSSGTGTSSDDQSETYAAEGATTGLAAGAGIGALWGLGILAGALPVIGPAFAAGTLATILSSAAAGAAVATLAGGLVGMGIPKEEAEFYESEVHSGRVLVTVSAAGRETEAREILRSHGSYDFSNASSTCSLGAKDSSTSRETSVGSQSGTVRAMEEELRVNKTPTAAGEVTVRKEVHTEHKTLEVPVTREEVVIERHAPTSAASGSTAEFGQHQEIRVPVSQEEVSVEKVPVVAEEISVSKRQVQGTEHVNETLRKEDIKVESSGNVHVRNENKRQ